MREYLLVCVVAMAVTYLATPLVRAVAVLVRAVTPIRERDVHSVPIPRLGGVGIFLGFAAATVVARQLPFLKGVYSSGQMTGVLLGALIIVTVGALDDIRELDWFAKFAGQALAAGVMAYKGVVMLQVPFFGTSTVLPGPVLIGITVLVVLVTTNAVNFIDGLDGLAAGLVAIASLAFFVYAYRLGFTYNPANVFSTATFVTAATLGCCLGFLPHNFNPARLFMGDSGALLLGLLLAAATVSLTGNVDPSSVSGDQLTAALLPIAAPLAVLSLPLLDMVLAIFRRARAGQRPWEADSLHLHHRMMRRGHGHRAAVLVLYLWAAVVALGTVSIAFYRGWWTVGITTAAVVAAAVLTAYLPSLLASRSRSKRL
ncbi:MAG: undecaprenyl/decaprenyl-phosphate alpha-N-acetylglucosaminyl 1-phosphate transferase [Dermatophilaceae bacterium]|nr:undecaprenyl/decaprenyl-phosphate alpha-N-acetylglucosaminyl 1-phosphate transferase [Actinomycetales bacterium]MBP8879518.1 undecaprenyl/decaprenyl-phosphate alpha-N-acetylglucosaminyl 1-phosphate transferase [Dermatophilaceae bacterium]MBP9918179.1 undecaprenyl/decaprenyl-phosphate alpha-N-acetylglucosaminyl 1-phosphate transferase [Dermatophilaceae bacterium]